MSEHGRILLADDERVFLRSTATLLRQEGYECDCAPDGSAALELLRAGGYDLVITDLKMPGNLDLEVLQEAARHAVEVPVIVVTAYPSVGTALAALRLPVIDYLVKPFDFNQLLAAVRQGIALAYSSRAVQQLQQRLQDWQQDTQNLQQALHTNQRNAAPAMEAFFSLAVSNLIECVSKLRPLADVLAPEPLQANATQESSPARTEERTSPPGGDSMRDFGKWKNTLLKISAILQESGAPLNTAVPSCWTEAFGEDSLLSSKEQLILHRVLAGQRVSAIARALSLSHHTVRNHLKSIFRKLNVHSQNELIAAFAMKA